MGKRNCWPKFFRSKKHSKSHTVKGTGQTGALKPAIKGGNVRACQNTWVQRPRTDNGEPCKTVLGPVSSQDRRTGSVLCEMVRKNTEKEILDLVEYMPIYRRSEEIQTRIKSSQGKTNKKVRFVEPSQRTRASEETKGQVDIPEDIPHPTSRFNLFRRYRPVILHHGLPAGKIYSCGQTMPGNGYKLKVSKVLAEGGQARVYLVKHEGSIFAAKLSILEKAPPDILQEFAFMSSFSHPNIANVICQIPRGFLMPVYTSDLGSRIKSLSRSSQYRIARGIFSAVAYIHELRIAHLDIKPDNILLTFSGEPKLSDFGAALRFGSEGGHFKYLKSPRGTLPYLCPEVLCGNRYSAMNLVDSWAVGATLYFMATDGYQPFKSGTPRDIYERQIKRQINFPPWLPQILQEEIMFARFIYSIMGLMCIEVCDRLTVKEAQRQMGWDD